VLSGPPGDLWRQALLGFEQDYPEIKVEFTGISARDYWPKVMQERQADQFLWDLRVGGADPDAYARKREGVLDPVRPLLLLPEVLDDSKWLGGLDSIFSDEERQFTPGFLANASSLASVNRDVVPEAELRSSRDLVQSQWKGKIATDDPRGGSGQGSLATMLYAYGEDWVRTLLTQQDIVVTGNGRQLAEWVVRARYPIGIGIGVTDLVAFHDQGLGRNVHYLGGAQSMSMGFGGIMVLNRRPHPAATTVFVNWLLTRATQERLAPMLRVNSRRTDVAPGTPEQALDPSRLDEYFPQQWERHGAMRERAGQLARELIK
jgi:ABC-type Fe3+ transport system substrate-binding protein